MATLPATYFSPSFGRHITAFEKLCESAAGVVGGVAPASDQLGPVAHARAQSGQAERWRFVDVARSGPGRRPERQRR